MLFLACNPAVVSEADCALLYKALDAILYAECQRYSKAGEIHDKPGLLLIPPNRAQGDGTVCFIPPVPKPERQSVPVPRRPA